MHKAHCLNKLTFQADHLLVVDVWFVSSEVVDKGGVDPLVALLNDAKPLIQANAAVCLTNLATEGRVTKVARVSEPITSNTQTNHVVFVTFSRAEYRLHVSPRVALVTCFPALSTVGCMFCRAWHWLHIFTRLASVTCFSALGYGYMFLRALHQVRPFPRLAPDACLFVFFALGTGCKFLFRLLIGSY